MRRPATWSCRLSRVEFGPRLLRHLLHELSFQSDGKPIHLAIDLVITIHEANAFGLHAAFEDFGGALQLQVFDHCHDVAVLENIAMRILHNSLLGAGIFLLLSLFLPIMPAGQAFVGSGMLQNIVESAKWAGHGVLFSVGRELARNRPQGHGERLCKAKPCTTPAFS